MPAEKATAIVIRLQDYSETSQIATFLTDRFGKVPAIAKGAKRSGSSTGGALDMLTLNEILFSPSRSGGLATLREARTIEQFPALRTTTSRYYAALYAAELAFTFSEGDEGTSDYFDLLLSVLVALSGQSPGVDNILAFCESRLLVLSGLQPNLRECARCGARPDARAPVRISLQDGGILCPQCPGGAVLARSCFAALSRVFDSTLTGVQRLRLPANIRRDLAGLLCAFIVHHSRRLPRLARYVKPDLDDQLRKWSVQMPPAN